MSKAHDIRVLVVRQDMCTVSFTETGSWKRAVERAVAEDDPGKWEAAVAFVHFRDLADPTHTIETYKVSELRRDLEEGKVTN